jgi:CIC family chloride channel protein
MERLHENEALPLIGVGGEYEGTVTAREIERAIREDTFDADLAVHAKPTPRLRVQDDLTRAVDALVKSELDGLPVLDGTGRSVVGWITHRDVLRAYRDRLEREIERSRRRTGARVPPLAELSGYRVLDLEIERPATEAVKLSDVPWPPSALVLFVREHGEIHDAAAETTLTPGDRVTVLVRAGEARSLARVFREVSSPA